MMISVVSSSLVWQLFSDRLESHEYQQQIRKCGKTEKYQDVKDEMREFFFMNLREMVTLILLVALKD